MLYLVEERPALAGVVVAPHVTITGWTPTSVTGVVAPLFIGALQYNIVLSIEEPKVEQTPPPTLTVQPG